MKREKTSETLRCSTKRLLEVMLTVLLSGALAVALSEAATPTLAYAGSTEPVAIKNVATKKCADLPGFGRGDVNGRIEQYDCRTGPSDNQQWKLLRHGRSHGYPAYLILNVKDGLCMDLPNFGRVPAGTEVGEYYCRHTNDNQLFYTKPLGHGSYFLVNAKTGYCLDVAGTRTSANGARLTVWPCSLEDDHVWRLDRVSTSAPSHGKGARVATSGGIVNVRSGPTVHAKITHRYANGTPVKLSCETSGDGRMWVKLASGKGYIARSYIEGVGNLPTCSKAPTGSGPSNDSPPSPPPPDVNDPDLPLLGVIAAGWCPEYGGGDCRPPNASPRDTRNIRRSNWIEVGTGAKIRVTLETRLRGRRAYYMLVIEHDSLPAVKVMNIHFSCREVNAGRFNFDGACGVQDGGSTMVPVNGRWSYKQGHEIASDYLMNKGPYYVNVGARLMAEGQEIPPVSVDLVQTPHFQCDSRLPKVDIDSYDENSDRCHF